MTEKQSPCLNTVKNWDTHKSQQELEWQEKCTRGEGLCITQEPPLMDSFVAFVLDMYSACLLVLGNLSCFSKNSQDCAERKGIILLGGGVLVLGS